MDTATSVTDGVSFSYPGVPTGWKAFTITHDANHGETIYYRARYDGTDGDSILYYARLGDDTGLVTQCTPIVSAGPVYTQQTHPPIASTGEPVVTASTFLN